MTIKMLASRLAILYAQVLVGRGVAVMAKSVSCKRQLK
jgi:hypothetical protein